MKQFEGIKSVYKIMIRQYTNVSLMNTQDYLIKASS